MGEPANLGGKQKRKGHSIRRVTFWKGLERISIRPWSRELVGGDEIFHMGVQPPPEAIVGFGESRDR